LALLLTLIHPTSGKERSRKLQLAGLITPLLYGKERHLMAVEEEIRQASGQFYAALNRVINGDPGPMVEVWSHGSDVSTVHPFGSRSLGWEEVRAGWEQAAQQFSDGQVALDDLVVVPIADDVAYTLGTEHGQCKIGGKSIRVDWRVSNIYSREAGGWKRVHHHTDVSPAVVETLDHLRGQQG
jgi:ketosteroid isomerase-like protein